MANDLSLNLCAYWKFDDSSTGTAVNSLSSGNLTAYQGPRQDVSGLIGSAVQYDSSLSSFYNTSVRPFPGDVSAFSVSLWVYPDTSLSTLGRSWQMIRAGTSPNSFSVQIAGANNNAISGYIYGIDASYIFQLSSANAVHAKQWNHIVVSWATGANPSIYSNNVNVTNSIQNSRTGFTATPTSVNIGIPNLSFHVGNGYSGNTLAGPGKLDEVGVWTRALTATEVSILYNGRTGFTFPFVEDTSIVIDLSTGLQGYWKLDESTGSTLYDSVGINHLTNSNAIMGSTDSVIGRSVEFDTSTDYIQDLTISGLDATNNAFSISLWAKFNRLARDAGYNMGLIRFQSTDGPGGNNNTASLFMSGSGESYNYLAGYTVNLDGSLYGVETGSSNITFVTNQWYHIVFTYSNDSSRGLIYVNGINCRGWHNNRIFVNPTLVQPNRYITAGNSYGGARVGIDGKIDEIGYWNRVLTPTEVSTLFNNGSGLTYPFVEEPTPPDPSDPYEILSIGLQSYWNLDEISGTTLYDSVGTNNLGLSGVIIGSSDSIINRAVVFDTSTDYLHKPSPTNIDASNNEFTVSFWAKYDEMPSTLGYSSSLIRFQSLDGPGGNSPTVYLNSVYSGSNNYITAYTYNQDGSAYSAYTTYGSSSILTTNQWFHIVYTYTNDSSRGIFYLNGQNAKYGDNNREFINPTLVQPNRYITVGNSYNGARYGFRGTIDEIGYWNRALTPAEVLLLYNNGNGLAYPFTGETGPTSPPTVTTSPITDVSIHTATGGGNVTHDGSIALTYRGICWSTSTNPTISVADGSTSNGSGTGVFTSYLTNLLPGTQYYVRAYAINSQGTSYGNNVQFTTLSRTLLTDLVSYWKLDEADGSVYDSVGTNHGNVVGATMNQPGKINSGVYFDTTNEIINCGTASSLRITQAITLSAWIKLPTTQNSYPRIVTKEGAYAMYVSTSNGNLRWFDGTNDIELNSVTNFDLRDNNWHIVTITYDRTSIRGYVDGSLVGAFSYTNALADVPSVPLTIGNRVAGDRYAIGTIDEIGVWSRALTPVEITQLYNNDKGLSYPFTSTLFNALATYSGFFVTYMGQTVWVFSV